MLFKPLNYNQKVMIDYAFIKELSTFTFVDKIILFGSRARKDNLSRADIDLAIVCPEATQNDWLDILEVIENADTLLSIDCVRFESLSKESKLKKNIINEGITLYAKDTD